MSSMIRLLSTLILGAIVTVGISFFVMTMGAIDAGVDMTDSVYEDEYASTTDMAIISIGLMKFLPIIIGVCALLIAVVGLKKYSGY